MANPAALLLQRLNAMRGNPSGATPDERRIAARHIEAIAELLDQMDVAGRKTVLFRRYFNSWVKMVYEHPHVWAGPNDARGKRDQLTALEHLEHLADLLDDLVPTLEDEETGIERLRQYANSARGLVDSDDSLDPLLKLHVKQVIAHLVWCVDNYDAVGDFDLQEAIERLFASMVRAGTTSKDKKRWFDWLMNNTVWPFTVNVASSIPSQALTQLLGGM